MKPLQRNEADFLRRTIAESDFDMTAAAKRLEISRTTLYRKAWKYGLRVTRSGASKIKLAIE